MDSRAPGVDMNSMPVLGELPDGYFLEESPRGVLAVHASVARILHEVGYGPETDGALTPASVLGRRPLWQFNGGEHGILLRRFSHGGLMRWVTGGRFLDPERPFRELILSDALLRVGIDTPRVLGARAFSMGIGWQLDVMTRRVEDTLDLGWVLGALRRNEVEPRSRQQLLERLGNLVRRLHLHGVLHADLQPNNILVNRAALEGADPNLWVLDLDRSKIVPELTSMDRLANLTRLYRHVARRDEQHGTAITRLDIARFFRGYDPERTSWRSDWHSVRERHALGRTFHRLGWVMERLFFGSQDDPRSERDEVLAAARSNGSATKG